jgi:hypothetical protein
MLELITPALYVALSPGELPLGDRLRHPMDLRAVGSSTDAAALNERCNPAQDASVNRLLRLMRRIVFGA